jgi:hypothetical protein
MSEEVLFAMKVYRAAFGWGQIFENVYFTIDRTVVARTSSKKVGLLFGLIGAGIDGALQQREDKKKGELYRKSSLDDIIKDNWNNYAIPNSEITAVELKKYFRNIKFNIKTSKKYSYKETKWFTGDTWQEAGEVYEHMLRPIFKDRLIVEK